MDKRKTEVIYFQDKGVWKQLCPIIVRKHLNGYITYLKIKHKQTNDYFYL